MQSALVDIAAPRATYALLLALLGAATACGARSHRSEEAAADRAGTAGTSSATPSLPGEAGRSSASAGSRASDGASGMGGTSGAGGAGGTGGASGGEQGDDMGAAGAPSFRECITDADCEVQNDCCACRAVPNGKGTGACQMACDEDACKRHGLPSVAQCTFGRCTLALSCNRAKSSCSAPLNCEHGHATPVIEQGCSVVCIPAIQCASVTDCAECGDDLCVSVELQNHAFRCVAKPPSCRPGNLCECLDACGGLSCSERDGKISCYCLAC